MKNKAHRKQEENRISGSDRPYIGRTIRVFISYSTKDKLLAGKIKDLLEVYGLEVFLAHEDIRPSADWQDVILRNLESTDIFIPIYTLSFKESAWADQESGYALAKGKKIIPLAINGFLPYGFLGVIQALNCNIEESNNSIAPLVDKIIKEIKENTEFKEGYKDGVVRGFVNSRCFADSRKLSREILEFDILTAGQINEVMKAALINSQIISSYEVPENIKKLTKKFESLIDLGLLSKIKEKYYPEKKILTTNDIPF